MHVAKRCHGLLEDAESLGENTVVVTEEETHG
jgi:hypothetical protein